MVGEQRVRLHGSGQLVDAGDCQWVDLVSEVRSRHLPAWDDRVRERLERGVVERHGREGGLGRDHPLRDGQRRDHESAGSERPDAPHEVPA